MAKEWNNHMEICRTVYDNGTVAAMLTQVEMSKRLTPAEMEQCLGRQVPASRPKRAARRAAREAGHTRPRQDAQGGMPGGLDMLTGILSDPNSSQEMRDFARMRLADETGEALPMPASAQKLVPPDESKLKMHRRYAQCPPQWANVTLFESSGATSGIDADTAVRSAAEAIMAPRGQARHIPRLAQPDKQSPAHHDSIPCYPNLLGAVKSCIRRHEQGVQDVGVDLCADAYVVWAWLAQVRSIEEGKRLITKAIELRPEHPRQLFMRSAFYAMTDIWSLALKDSLDSRKLETDPYEHWDLGSSIGKCLNRLHRVDEAVVYLEESCKAVFDINDPIGAQYQAMDAATRGRCVGNLYLLAGIYNRRGSRADLELAKNRYQEAEKRERKLDAEAKQEGGYGEFKMIAQLAATTLGVNKVGECSHCRQPAEKLLRCAACESAAYCSKRCQKRDWNSGHKKECAAKKLQMQQRLEKRIQSKQTRLQIRELPPVDGDLDPEELWQFGADHADAQPDESAWCFLVSIFMDFSKTGRDVTPVKRAVQNCASGSKVAIALEPFAKKDSTTLPQAALQQAHQALHSTLPLHHCVPRTLADQDRDSFAAGCATLFWARFLSQAGNATLDQQMVEEACRLTSEVASAFVDPHRYLTMQFELGYSHRDLGAWAESLRWFRSVQKMAPPQPSTHWSAMLLQAQYSITMIGRGETAEANQRAMSVVRSKRGARARQHTEGSTELSQANARKQEGNSCFGDREYLAAAKAFTEAIDDLHGLSADSVGLSPEEQCLLATCLSNRAECRLQLASTANDEDRDAQGLAQAASADCAYVQRLNQRYIPQRVKDKTESRTKRADAFLAVCREEEFRNAEPQQLEPEPEPPTESSGSYACNRCGIVKNKAEFSGNQWKTRKKRTRGVAVGGKCRYCVQMAAAERISSAVQPVASPPLVQGADMTTEEQEQLRAVLGFLGLEEHFEHLVQQMFDCSVCVLASDEDWTEIGIALADARLIRDACVTPPTQATAELGLDCEADTANESEEPKFEPDPDADPEPKEKQLEPQAKLENNKRTRHRLKRLPTLIKGSEVAAYVRFPEDICPMCLEQWSDTGEHGLAKRPVVALECGHAVCLACMHEFRIQCAIPFHTEDIDEDEHATKWVCFCTKPLPKKKKYWTLKPEK